MQFIDTHCHIYDEAFDEDRQQVIERAKENNVLQFVLPNVDLTTTDRLFSLPKTDKCFFPLMGLHPTSVNENVEKDLQMIKIFFDKQRIYGIGEVGLDFYWDKTFKDEQIYAFCEQIKWSEEKNNLPIVIHCRKAFDDALACLKKMNKKTYNGIFHCFSGDKRQAETLIEMGFSLGIGGVLTFKNAHLAEIVKEIPIEKLVLETDCPYLTPAPYRGKRNESSYIPLIAEKLSEIKGISIEQVAEITTNNAKKIFNI
jgi:TatD DNase family protein